MTIKVGDKVRIKTEQELLAEGWVPDSHNRKLCNDELFVWKDECGRIVKVRKLDKDGLHFETWELRFPISAVEVLPQTLDEYIYSLPLEERAKWFVYKYKEFVYAGFDSYYTKLFASSLTQSSYLTYDEALQATIEALRGEKK